jgi:hypothetical protein
MGSGNDDYSSYLTSSSPRSLPSPLLLISNIFKISKIFLSIQWVSRLITVLRSTTLSISINRDPGTVYEFVLNPENLPRWAIMAFRSVKQRNNKWIAETPKGPAKVSHTKRNEFGILDHYVKTSSGVDVFVPCVLCRTVMEVR